MLFVVSFCVLCFRLVFIFKCLHLQPQKHTYKHINTNIITLITKHNNSEKQTHTEISQPEPEIYLFAVGSWAGYPVFIYVCFVLFFELLFLFSVSLCILCFRLVFLTLLHLQSKNTHINTEHNMKLKEQQQNIKHMNNRNLPAGT